MEKSLQDTYAPHTRCFGCGPSNEKGLQIKSFVQGNELVAHFRPQPHHEAFPGMTNGGIIGALLDCHSNWTACWALMNAQKSGGAGSAGDGRSPKGEASTVKPPVTVTADFHVTLKRPTPLDAELEIRAHVAELQGDRAVIEATVSANGKVTATCRGTFVAVREGHPAYHRW